MIRGTPAYLAWQQVKSLEQILEWIKLYVPNGLAMLAIGQLENIYGVLAKEHVKDAKTIAGNFVTGAVPYYKYLILIEFDDARRRFRIKMVPGDDGTVIRIETDLGRPQ